ncbi:DsbA family oxidoreductase [Thermoflavimicrobium dichotomicum]|uniref:Predicted dithiol-disulfide isomerase, DsbA family n=1 Tax=Thermoflavimicrobium dichotomicum TaxID=46223 RepID=A0A1I3P6Y8_9BACL|nr:DsbA family protein [Thermoflavimicrobium dichotomicum]SFJ17100.1 Predicted dithiol-disulfide isomerase, DsbA family [Thermoflavimicrobium dichotomicum]
MTLKMKVYSDYVCPFCFLGKKLLEETIKGKDIVVEWMPFELQPYPTPPVDPWNDPGKLEGWKTVILPYAKKWGIDMKLPPFSPHPYTHLAFEGFQYAKEHGKANEYNDRVFTAFFQEGQNIGEIDVLTKLASEIGLNAEEFKNALETRKYKDTHLATLRHAYEEANIHAVPTFVIGKQVVQGIRSKKVFEKIINQELKNETFNPSAGLACDMENHGP